MYLEIDEGFDAHPKTVRLCRVIGDVNAGQYLIRLWAWACRSAQDGDLSGMEAGDVEAIAKYAAGDGRLFSALTERWSPKFGPWLDSEGGTLKIHGWGDRQGAAIQRMEKRAAYMRSSRAKKEPTRDSHVPVTNESRDTVVSASPVQSSPVQTSQGDPPARDPGTTDTDVGAQSVPAPVGTNPLMPDTAERLVWALKSAVEKARPERGMYAPGPFADKDAGVLLRQLGDASAAAPEILRRIGLFVADDTANPWTVKVFCQRYNGIGVARTSMFEKPKQREAKY